MTHSAPQGRVDARERLEARMQPIAVAWRAALTPTSYVPMGAAEQRQALTELTRRVIDVLLGSPFSPKPAQAVGAELVKLGYVRPAAIGRTIEVLGRELLASAEAADLPELQTHVPELLSEVAAGFAYQMGERILGEQETIREALLTQRDQAEEAMRESEARFRAIFEGAPFGIAVADMQGRVLTANPALQAILGWSDDEMRGRVIVAELAHPDDAEESASKFMELAEGRSDRYEVEQRFFARDGSVMWAQVAMALVRDTEGK